MYYFYYIKDNKCLYKDLFRLIERQLKYTNNIIETVNKIRLKEKQDKKENKKEGKIGTKKAINNLNKLTLKLSFIFI